MQTWADHTCDECDEYKTNEFRWMAKQLLMRTCTVAWNGQKVQSTKMTNKLKSFSRLLLLLLLAVRACVRLGEEKCTRIGHATVLFISKHVDLRTNADKRGGKKTTLCNIRSRVITMSMRTQTADALTHTHTQTRSMRHWFRTPF